MMSQSSPSTAPSPSSSHSATSPIDNKDYDLTTSPVAGESSANRQVSSSKRAAQNRAAQRAFRQRKDRYIKDLEVKATELEVAQKSIEELRRENTNLQELVKKLQLELAAARKTGGAFPDNNTTTSRGRDEDATEIESVHTRMTGVTNDTAPNSPWTPLFAANPLTDHTTPKSAFSQNEDIMQDGRWQRKRSRRTDVSIAESADNTSTNDRGPTVSSTQRKSGKPNLKKPRFEQEKGDDEVDDDADADATNDAKTTSSRSSAPPGSPRAMMKKTRAMAPPPAPGSSVDGWDMTLESSSGTAVAAAAAAAFFDEGNAFGDMNDSALTTQSDLYGTSSIFTDDEQERVMDDLTELLRARSSSRRMSQSQSQSQAQQMQSIHSMIGLQINGMMPSFPMAIPGTNGMMSVPENSASPLPLASGNQS